MSGLEYRANGIVEVAQPVRELKGFHRVMPRPGESRPLEFTLSTDDLVCWNDDVKNVVEPVAVTVWGAPTARSGQGTDFTITG
jgi:beta-glucosidase